MKKAFFYFFLTFLFKISFCQDNFDDLKNKILNSEHGYSSVLKFDLTNRFDEFKNKDLSQLWSNMNSEVIYGFIGENFLRIKIKYISIIQNRDKPLEYFIYGKTKVKDNICTFQGIISVQEVYYADNLEFPNSKCGIVICEYNFFEDNKVNSTGLFKGKLLTFWTIKDNKIVYDDLMSSADGYDNNLHVGYWQGYNKTN